MALTPRQIAARKLARRVKILNRRLLQEELFPTDKDGSTVRDFLRKEVAQDGLARFGHATELYVQIAPVYTPSESGCCTLATETGDMSLLLDCPPKFTAQDVPHHLGVSRTIINLDKAIAAQSVVQLPQLFTEHCLLNPYEKDPAKKRRLFTIVGHTPKGGNVVCVPDFAALIRVGKFVRPYCFEYETGSDGSPSRVAARKAPGYYALNDGGHFKQFFPEATDVKDMRVIAICPNLGWLQGLRRAMQDRPGKEKWLFVARENLSAAAFLHGPIFWSCAEDSPIPLVRLSPALPAPAPLPAPLQEPVGGVGARGSHV